MMSTRQDKAARLAERKATNEKLRAAMQKMNDERVALGQCRHCGGEVPCWSMFGDIEVGKRRQFGS